MQGSKDATNKEQYKVVSHLVYKKKGWTKVFIVFFMTCMHKASGVKLNYILDIPPMPKCISW